MSSNDSPRAGKPYHTGVMSVKQRDRIAADEPKRPAVYVEWATVDMDGKIDFSSLPLSARYLDKKRSGAPPASGLRQSDRLTHSIAVAAALVVCAVALRSAAVPDSRSVFNSLEDSFGIELDDSLGKLTFVGNIAGTPLSDKRLVLENDEEIVHAYAESEPYVGLYCPSGTAFALQDSVVMAIGHGENEELLVRLRGIGGVETVYGNLASLLVREGDEVAAGAALGEVIGGRFLTLECMMQGESVSAASLMVYR
ncbi:MAG: M23 family metallopeptidase [Eubacteriales bacterium]|nr:M23 family metallopeptidase [Eubacteriales bacterium]MDD3882798.1 M23 family metallopeptidase [Eubacteriales bacterium]MDD4513304.1 M23 family metallopeptidase [Eubacteriales bacterium]